ncbi:unnamed protein product [Adineta steineri]|uniref:Uncharacterized protein n=1 Tax=Adineta steineri TaxID=433720 RepID=A0A819TS17_9BILA|nr:unnamed protein product [Adineta steineri]
MSIQNCNKNQFSLVWLGTESDENVLGIKFINEFKNYDEFKEYTVDKSDCSIILIVSSNILLDNIFLTDTPQICAVYNDKLVCLYCLSTLALPVHTYMRNIQDEQLKKKTKENRSSCLLTILQKFWFHIVLILVICLAYLFPNVGKTGGYIRSEWTVKLGCIILLFFLSGLSVRTQQLLQELLHIRLHVLVQIYSLIIIPFTTYGLALLLIKLSLNKALIVGIIIMASTCTTISSNSVMTKNAMGNEYAALLNAVLGNLLGIFVSPAMIFYFLKNPVFDSLSITNNTNGQVNYGRIIKNLILTALIPFFVGQIIRLLWPKQVMDLRQKLYFAEVTSLAILTLVWAVFCTAFATGSFQAIQKKDLLILVLTDAGIYVFFSSLIMFIARLPIPCWQFSRKDTVAIMFCGATKALTIGITLINAFYGNQNQDITGVLSLPMIIYHVEQLAIGAIEVVLLKKWIERGINKQTSVQNDNINIPLKNTDDLQVVETEIINVKCQ